MWYLQRYQLHYRKKFETQQYKYYIFLTKRTFWVSNIILLSSSCSPLIVFWTLEFCVTSNLYNLHSTHKEIIKSDILHCHITYVYDVSSTSSSKSISDTFSCLKPRTYWAHLKLQLWKTWNLIQQLSYMLPMIFKTPSDLRSSFFWDITPRRFVVSYRRFGTNYLSLLQGSSRPRGMPGTRALLYRKRCGLTLEDGTDKFPETSITK
jgi:hypothetical protein